MTTAGRLALWLGSVLAAWSVAGAVAALRTSRADVARLAVWGLAGAVASAAAALGVLITALVTHDFGVRFVAARSSVLMPARYLAASVLGAPDGALLALAVVAGCAALVAAWRAADALERTWVIACGAGLVAIALPVAAAGLPFARTFGFRADGSVLSPDLQRGAAVLHALALLAGSACATAAFAATVGALATGRLGARWSADLRWWNAVGWCALFVAAVAGYRRHVLSPLLGPWAPAPLTAPWLLPCAMGAWLVHLDAGRATPERAVTRMLLVAATFVATCAAIALGGGAFVRGLTDAPAGHGAWFGAAAAAALVLTIAVLRRARGALSLRVAAAGGDHAHVPRARVSRVAGVVAHAGIALVAAVTIAGRYARPYPVQLVDTGIFRARDLFGRQWSFTSEGMSTLARDNYSAAVYALRVARDGVALGLVTTDARSYALADEASDAVAGIAAGVRGGALVEARVEVVNPATTPPTLRVTFVPLGSWLVPAVVLTVVGTLLALAGFRGAGRAPSAVATAAGASGSSASRRP
ncbi:MAG TPA: hypothetical protein VG916_02285 [Gemmatimonadaceae bacterium]|nr:hypothetical protein [Gemmatimonadaceae bacterium]